MLLQKKDINKLYFYWLTALLGVLAVSMLYLSLYWKMAHDLPLMMYNALLIEHFGKIPYKDVLDFNMPGSYFFYIIAGKISGYTDIGIRIVDILSIAFLSMCSFFTLRKIDKRAGILSILLYTIYYLSDMPYLTLQRDYFGLLCLAACIAFYFNFSGRPQLKYLICGVLLGVCATVKPQAFVFMLTFLFFALMNRKKAGERKRDIIPNTMIGFAVPVGIVFLYLLLTGALYPFFDLLFNYVPLYGKLSGSHYNLLPEKRFEYSYLEFVKFGSHPLWLLSMCTGMYFFFFKLNPDEYKKRIAGLLFFMAVTAALYVIPPGQFFPHHWMMFFYFAILLSSLCILKLPESVKLKESLVPLLVLSLVVLTNMRPYEGFISQLKGKDITGEYGERINMITDYLSKNLQPGDKIQPLEWTGGALHSMLITRTEPATKYIYDTYFYHHISNPYIQKLRADFIKSFKESNPRFVIRIYTIRAVSWGPDTTTEFPELDEILKENYIADIDEEGYKVYRRKI